MSSSSSNLLFRRLAGLGFLTGKILQQTSLIVIIMILCCDQQNHYHHLNNHVHYYHDHDKYLNHKYWSHFLFFLYNKDYQNHAMMIILLFLSLIQSWSLIIMAIKMISLDHDNYQEVTFPLTSPYFLSLSSDKSPTSWKNELEKKVKNRFDRFWHKTLRMGKPIITRMSNNLHGENTSSSSSPS